MQLTDTDIQKTVLSVFARGEFLHGDVMCLSFMEQQWAGTSLRRADLVAGLAQLCTMGLLDLAERGGETNLSLTAIGQARIADEFSAGAAEWERHLQQNLLPAVRGRHVPPLSNSGGRRSYEAETTHIPFTHA